MTGESATVSLVMLVSLGAFHGVNPGMGWLFAVALGMQERRRGAVLRALVPLGAGHALAVAGAVAAAIAIGGIVPMGALRWIVAGILITLGVTRMFRHRHPRWVGMRVGPGRLTLWSFLMATAHGAGLMVVPVFATMSLADGADHAHHAAAGAATTASAALIATGVHALAYLAVTAFVAVLVFDRLGVGMLRRAWINLDLIWAVALAASGVATLML
ncbi:MAG TPA: hypothetical protein VFP85_03080 [Vicinamibacterales bacterium]|nr:hypothetical protein [Vicinamibacterales bacterium]